MPRGFGGLDMHSRHAFPQVVLAAITLVEDKVGDDSGLSGREGHLGCMTDPKLLDQKPRGLA